MITITGVDLQGNPIVEQEPWTEQDQSDWEQWLRDQGVDVDATGNC